MPIDQPDKGDSSILSSQVCIGLCQVEKKKTYDIILT